MHFLMITHQATHTCYLEFGSMHSRRATINNKKMFDIKRTKKQHTEKRCLAMVIVNIPLNKWTKMRSPPSPLLPADRSNIKNTAISAILCWSTFDYSSWPFVSIFIVFVQLNVHLSSLKPIFLVAARDVLQSKLSLCSLILFFFL